MNLIAAQKAKGGIAYSTASNYLTTGRQCLEASSWKTNYDLTLELYVETTEVAYLCGEFEQVEYWAVIVLQEAKTVLDTVKVYEVKIQTDIAQNQPLKAIDIALQVLQQLGIDFPKTPSQSDIRLELDAITALFNEKEVESLIDLPEMTEPSKLAAMRILSSITIAAQIAASDLIPLLAAKQVSLSIQYGNAFVSPSAYATLGLVLCGIIGNIDTGYQFGQLALNLLSQPHTYVLKARTLLIVNSFIIHWKKHTRELLQPLLEGYQIGLETGDLESAAYCAYVYCSQSFINGKELVEIERDIVTYGEAIHHIKQKIALTWTQNRRQVVINLMGGLIDSTRLIDEFYNEEIELPQHETENDETAIVSLHFDKLYLCYLFSEYAQAIENATLAETYLNQLTGGAFVGGAGEPLYYLYSSLARLAAYSESSTQARSEILKRVAVGQEKMKHWAYHAPMNYLHKYHLVEAEKARVLGQFLEAEEFYEQAISGASENEFIQEEALAYELAAKHYLARGRSKIAQTYMKEAHYCYDRWGATAKVKDLETRYPQFFSQLSRAAYTSIPITAETITNPFHAVFDIAAVMKASQAISREIELKQLLRSLMQILIENAGAQTGHLILENSGKWSIEAACELNTDENSCVAQVLQSIPIADQLPESIIQYVIRTLKPVTLNDATREGAFIHEPYIQQHQPQSVCCLPLLNQAKLVGVLYLENRLATGVFTPERSQVLQLLSTQAAIAIENAQLYAKLRTSESQITQFLEAVQVGIGVLDATGCPYYVNERGIQLLGKGVEPTASPENLSEIYQIYLSGTNQIYPTEKMPLVRALSGERTRIDNMEIHQNGKIIPVEAWGTPIFDEQGNVAYAITAFQDITERKQAEKLLADYNYTLEQQVAERTAALRQSEANYRNLLKTANSIILRTDRQGRIRYMNDYGLSFLAMRKIRF